MLPPTFLRLRQSILILDVGGTGTCLIDLDGAAAALDRNSAEWLSHLLREGTATTAKWAAQRFQVSPEIAENDVQQFASQLQAGGFLEPARFGGWSGWSVRSMTKQLRQLAARVLVGSGLRVLQRWSNRATQAWWLLLLARWSIRWFGWTATVATWKRCLPMTDRGLSVEQRKTLARDLDELVRSTAARHWFHVECKERGLTCWGLGRWQGVPVQLVIGFETSPFGGHCWVELEDGSVISDNPEFCRSYQPVVRYW